MTTEDLNSSLLQNPVNPKVLQESLGLGKANIRMTCFPHEKNGYHIFSYNKRNDFSRELRHTKYKRKKFKK